MIFGANMDAVRYKRKNSDSKYMCMGCFAKTFF